MGALSKTVLGEHYTIAKSAGSISVGEIVGLILAAIWFYLSPKILGKEGTKGALRFPIALLILLIFCMVD